MSIPQARRCSSLLVGDPKTNSSTQKARFGPLALEAVSGSLILRQTLSGRAGTKEQPLSIWLDS